MEFQLGQVLDLSSTNFQSSESFYYKLIIEYNGMNYFGFQVQESVPTIQGELIKATNELLKGHGFSDVQILGSGRTDAGVHAKGQVVRLRMALKMPGEKLKYALNAYLPLDIRVIASEMSSESFHPIFQAKEKEYRYYFYMSEDKNPFLKGLVTHLPAKNHVLDFQKIEEALKLFLGEHDFFHFQCVGTDVATTVRKIYQAEICKDHYPQFIVHGDPIYYVRFVGSGFLKQMVRLMVSALWAVGSGDISLGELKRVLNPENTHRDMPRIRLAPVAPPDGLYLYGVKYDD